MNRQGRARIVGLMCAAAASVVAIAQAEAGGFQLKELSADSLATSLAGQSAKASDASTVFSNPAGMTRLQGHHLSATTSGVMPYASFSGGATRNGAPIAGSIGGDAIGDGLVGGGYGVYSFSNDLKFGVAVVSPFGLRSKYASDFVGRYQALDSSLMNFQVQPTIAYRINSALSVGLGIDISYTTAKLGTAIDLPALTGGLIRSDAYGQLSGDSTNVGFNVGVLYEFSPTTRIGLDYRSRISTNLKGDANFVSPVPLAALPAALRAALTNTSGSAKLTLPDVASLGFYHEVTPDFALMAEVQWTNWSLFKELRIKYGDGRPDSVTAENWRDGWFFSVGGNYKFTQQFAGQLGIGYEIAPVTDTVRTARIPDADRLWTSAGISYEFTPNSKINLSYAHLFGVGSNNISHVTPATPSLPITYRTTGSYNADADIISLGYSVKF